jgi:hypothetical protein
MIRWKQVHTIASFEFFTAIKRKSYLIATFGMPLFILLYAGIISGFQSLVTQEDDSPRVYGIVDRSGLLDLTEEIGLSDPNISPALRATLEAAGRSDLLSRGLAVIGQMFFRPYSDKELAQSALAGKQIRGYFIVPEDYVTKGRLELYSTEEPSLKVSGPHRPLSTLLQRKMLEGQVTDELAARIRNPIGRLITWMVDENGEVTEQNPGTLIARLVIPLAFTFLLFSALMMSAGFSSLQRSDDECRLPGSGYCRRKGEQGHRDPPVLNSPRRGPCRETPGTGCSWSASGSCLVRDDHRSRGSIRRSPGSIWL